MKFIKIFIAFMCLLSIYSKRNKHHFGLSIASDPFCFNLSQAQCTHDCTWDRNKCVLSPCTGRKKKQCTSNCIWRQSKCVTNRHNPADIGLKETK